MEPPRRPAPGPNQVALVAQRARPGVVLGLLALHGPAIALFTAVPALAALADGAWLLATALGLASVPPLMAYAHRRLNGPVGPPRRVEALVTVAAAFVLAIALTVPGFLALGLSPVDAVFEATSAVTTTGLSVADTADWPPTAHLFRAWLQWAGGFAFAVLALALIVAPGATARRLGLVEKPGEGLTGSTRARARQVLAAYVALSVAAGLACAVAAADAFEGALIALAAVSTGGFAPAPTSLSGSGLALQVVAVTAMLAGAISMTLYAQAWRDGPARALADPELRLLLTLLAAAAAGVILVEALRTEGGVGPWDALVSTVSAQTTAGFSTRPMADLAPASQILLVVVMVIGGSIGATAGGIKIFRAAFAASAARTAFARSRAARGAVMPLRVFGRKTSAEEGADVFALCAVYAATALGLWALLAAYGHPPLAALFDTVSALSTVGLSMGVAGPGLAPELKLALCLAMLLGRLEFLAVLVLLCPATWYRP